ncbi:MAG: Rpn family recombination-promoting nuclease/putative transposase [Treponema sp.]|nr:Rpn family recombination-promoting nuclease/putative transposase [Treponema sp.]
MGLDEELNKKWENATLANNFIFYKVMREYPNACKHLIEMLLKIKIGKMVFLQEEYINLDNEGKAIRLDVFVKDKNRLIDVEIQLKDTKELPERARYYQGLMDLDSLGKGESYKKLKDSHVIFICMENIFSAQKKDLPVYTFENMCREDNSVKLNDRTYKHFFIAPTCAKMIEDEEIRSFFEFLITNNPADNYTSELDSYVTYAKKNMQWRMEFMTWERMETYKYEEGFEDGEQNGRQNKAIEDATNFLKEKISPEIIARCVGLPLEEVLKLAEGIELPGA